MSERSQILRTTLAWGGLLAFMTLFRPENLPVAALIIPFVLMYAAFFSLWRLVGRLRVRYFVQKSSSFEADIGPPATAKARGRLATAVCAALVLLVVLQSLGQLSLRDVVTLAAILALGYLYLARTKFVVPRS